MQFQLLQLFSFILYFFTLIVSADDAARFITKDGVIYSYAVKTKTLQPARVVVSTRYYTTVHVRQITLANNEVTSTTEQITTESTFTSSIPAVTAAVDNNNNAAAVTTTHASSVVSATTDVHTENTQGTKSTVILSPSQNNSPVVSETSTSLHVPTSSRIPTTITPTSEASKTSNTQTAVTTSMNDDGTCYVYFEDDEYYSTFYITAASQTVDAASTITSTRTKTVYQTIAN
ncbi:protein Dse2p [Monosporozyma unispora]|nr:daughter-specific expression- protein [Kazachstania unispora]